MRFSFFIDYIMSYYYFLSSFLVLNSQSNLPIDSKILALVLETKTKLEKIQDIQNQND